MSCGRLTCCSVSKTDAQKADWFDAATEEFLAFDDDKLGKEIIPKLTKRIMALQKSRRAMQKLPEFPDADLIRSLNEQKDAGMSDPL